MGESSLKNLQNEFSRLGRVCGPDQQQYQDQEPDPECNKHKAKLRTRYGSGMASGGRRYSIWAPCSQTIGRVNRSIM